LKLKISTDRNLSCQTSTEYSCKICTPCSCQLFTWQLFASAGVVGQAHLSLQQVWSHFQSVHLHKCKWCQSYILQCTANLFLKKIYIYIYIHTHTQIRSGARLKRMTSNASLEGYLPGSIMQMTRGKSRVELVKFMKV
jgi:hypothetical protein